MGVGASSNRGAVRSTKGGRVRTAGCGPLELLGLAAVVVPPLLPLLELVVLVVVVTLLCVVLPLIALLTLLWPSLLYC